MKKCKSGEMLLVMSDWNAKIGCSVEQPMVGGFGLGSRNKRGYLLVDLCHENSMVVTNTWFKNHPRWLYTRRSSGDSTLIIILKLIIFCHQKDSEIPYLIARPTHKQIVTLTIFCW